MIVKAVFSPSLIYGADRDGKEETPVEAELFLAKVDGAVRAKVIRSDTHPHLVQPCDDTPPGGILNLGCVTHWRQLDDAWTAGRPHCEDIAAWVKP